MLREENAYLPDNNNITRAMLKTSTTQVLIAREKQNRKMINH